jgi:hypothetical protein
MLNIAKSFLLLLLFSVGVLSQDRIQQIMVGPAEDKFRVVIAFIDPTEDSFKMQSLIVDFDKPKDKNDLPTTFKIDVTSTVRSLATGEKKQKILILQVKNSTEIQFKCDGKYIKKDSTPNTDKLIETVKAILKTLPLDSKKPTAVKLSKETEANADLVFKSVNTEEFPCLRNLN